MTNESKELHVMVGAGQVGDKLARILLSQGRRVRMVRRGQSEGPEGVEWARGDITDRAFADEAFRGAAVILQLRQPGSLRHLGVDPADAPHGDQRRRGTCERQARRARQPLHVRKARRRRDARRLPGRALQQEGRAQGEARARAVRGRRLAVRCVWPARRASDFFGRRNRALVGLSPSSLRASREGAVGRGVRRPRSPPRL